MNFQARGRLHGTPELKAKFKIDPLRFETKVAGSCECDVGAISAHIGDMRIRCAIPFMKPRRKLPLVATIGGFRFRLRPFEMRVGTKGIGMSGTLGTEGVGAGVDGLVACQMEGEIEGTIPTKSGHIHVDLEECEGG